MKFTINQNALSNGISIVQRAIVSRSTMKELEGVLLTLKDNRLKLTGTDSEIISIETFLDCNGMEDGITLVNAKIFGDIVRKLPNDVITIEIKDDRMIIKCQKSNFNLLVSNYREYPNLPTFVEENSILIKKHTLKNAIRQTSYAVSQDLNRRSLTGVLFEVKSDQISFVALDGYRLSVFKEPTESEGEYSVIVPGRALNELQRILDDEDDDVRMNFARNNISFVMKDTVFYSQLIDGQFFNYKDIIRKEHNCQVKINRHSLQLSLERAGLLAKEEKANLVKLEFIDDQLKIQSNTELGNVEEFVDIEKTGSNMEIAFNSRYLIEGIKNMEDSEIELKLQDEVNPLIIEGVEKDNYLYLVLPVRLA